MMILNVLSLIIYDKVACLDVFYLMCQSKFYQKHHFSLTQAFNNQTYTVKRIKEPLLRRVDGWIYDVMKRVISNSVILYQMVSFISLDTYSKIRWLVMIMKSAGSTKLEKVYRYCDDAKRITLLIL